MRSPNVIYILADDLGWGDVGYHGSPIRTPNFDRLARHGVELDCHYVCPVCTPTRVSLLTGRHPGRFGKRATTPTNSPVLPDNYYTLAHLFRDAGYVTGLFGKWHLGSDPRYGPNYYGFDHSYGALAGCVDPYNHLYKPGPYLRTWHRNGTMVDETGHATELLTDEAIRWMDEQSQPFFCYLPYTAVHTPVRAPESWIDRYADLELFDDPEKNEAFQRYAAYTSHLDHAVGQIIEYLKLQNMLDETIVVLASDNGAVTYEKPCDRLMYPGYRDDMQPAGSNTPFRGHKATLYEGGIRTPAVISWRGTLEPAKVEAPMHICDWMPTFSSLLGVSGPKSDRYDGRNMWPVFTGETAPDVNRRIYWNLQHNRFAVRENGWKLIRKETDEGASVELFHIEKDPSEKEDLAADRSDKVEELTKAIKEEHAKDDVPMR